MTLDDGLLVHQSEAAAIVAQLEELGPQQVLRKLRTLLGVQAFSIIALFSIEAASSLRGDAETVTWHMTGDDLDWPQDRLRQPRLNTRTHWTAARLALFDEAVAAYRAKHPDVVLRTCTVIGYWSGDKVVVTGVIDGKHNVWGGTDETGDGLFAGVFEIDGASVNPEADLAAAIAATYYH